MEKAVLAAQELRSAAFSATVDLHRDEGGRDVTIKAQLDGRTQDAGKELALSVDMDMSSTVAGQMTTLGAKGDVVVLDEGETYLRVTSVEGNDPTFANPMLVGLLNQWWKLPVTGSGAAGAMDPRLLRLQTEVLRVTDDHGIEEYGNKEAYHYDVGVDEGKFVAFFEEIAAQRGDARQTDALRELLASDDIRGEAWIDAATFQVLRLKWDIASKEGKPPMAFALDVSFSGHNAADPITPPADAQPFPNDLQRMMGLPSPLPPAAAGEELPPEVQEEILRSILENR